MSLSGLTGYFQLRLDSLGFDSDELEVFYSLGHCQGDGVAFYGHLSSAVLVEVFRIAKGLPTMAAGTPAHFLAMQQLGKVRQLLDNSDCTSSIEGKESRYHHESSMRFNLEIMEFPDENESVWELVAQDVENTVQDYLTQCSCILRDEGYAVIDAGGPGYNESPRALTRFGRNANGHLIRFEVDLIQSHLGVDECPAFDWLEEENFQSILSDIQSYKNGQNRWSAFEGRSILLDQDGDDLHELDDWCLTASFADNPDSILDVAKDVLAELSVDIVMFHPSHSEPPVPRAQSLAVIDLRPPEIVSAYLTIVSGDQAPRARDLPLAA